MSEAFPEVFLSVVATSRNDDHGGNLLGRMQAFVDGFAEQCRRHDLAAELILVEWNPPPDPPSLAEALRWPQGGGPFSIRIIQVPPELHARLANADRLPLFQMVAKNVGIRRARGDFVLATNIDILFSDALFRFMRDRLRRGKLYRVDRYDVPSDLPAGAPLTDVLRFCENNTIRINRRGSIYLVKERKSYPIYQSLGDFTRAWARRAWQRAVERARALLILPIEAARRVLRGLLRRLAVSFKPGPRRTVPPLGRDPDRPALMRGRRARGLSRGLWRGPEHPSERSRQAPPAPPPRAEGRAGPRRFIAAPVIAGRKLVRKTLAPFVAFAVALKRFLEIPRLHTAACGDFTLMSREDWFDLRGYPEWEIFSMIVDSVLIHQAHGNGIPIVEIPDPGRIYHIEHGSGWSLEGQQELFARLERDGIPYLSYEDFVRIAKEIRVNAKAKRPTTFNGADWGFADEDLLEVVVCASTASPPRAAHPSSLAGGA